MSSSHYHTVLNVGSFFIGQNCPVSRQRLQVGQAVVVCTDTQTAFEVESWQYLGEMCPFCPVTEATLSETGLVEDRPDIGAGAWLSLPGRSPFPLEDDLINVGRGPDNHLVLEDERVSQYHARIRRSGRVFYLFDLASTNGTWVNGQRIFRLLLRDGDKIQVGNTTLVFKQVVERPPSLTKSGDTDKLPRFKT
jgi:hypothetical protein